MPSAIRQTAAAAVSLIRTLETGIKARRSHHHLMLGSAAKLVQASEALETRVARLDPAVAAQAAERVRDAVASLGSTELRGDAPGLATMGDQVSRLIVERQLPILYKIQLLAAAFDGVEAGLRALALAREAPTTARPASGQPSTPDGVCAPAAVDFRPTPASPTPDAMDNLIGRATVSPAAASGTTSGQITIKKDTERI